MNTKHVTFAGDFLKKTEVDILRPVEAVLEKVGEDATRVMRRYVRSPFVSRAARGELEESITWRTSNNHGEIEDTHDLIKAPPRHCVDIGSANEHAFYVDKGTSPHLNKEGTVEFVAEIKDWTRRMGWDEDVAWAIIKKIRDEGTDAIPFKEPTENRLSSIAKPICEKAIREYWATQRQV